MAPKVPVANKQTASSKEGTRAPRKAVPGERQQPSANVGTLSLLHKVRLTAALLSNDAAGVFEQVFMLPILQALGTPVALVTVSGCISASLAIGAVPLCGWLSDGGSNPRKRKKLALFGAAFVMFMGLGLILTGNALRIWIDLPSASSARSEFPHVSNGTAASNRSAHSPEHEDMLESFKRELNVSTTETSIITEIIPGVHIARIAQNESTTDVESFSDNKDVDSEDIPKEADVGKFFTDPLGIGLPLVALMAMMGFVLLDVGYDLTGSSVKIYMLSVSPPADHLSLLVMGVLVSALGGCSTAITGLIDLTPVLGVTPNTNAVCSQAVVQLLVIMALVLLCTICSLVSAPSDIASNSKEDEVKLLPERTDEGGTPGVTLDLSTATLQTEVQESIIMATTSPADVLGLSVSTRVERSHDAHNLSIRLGATPAPFSSPSDIHLRTRLLDKKVTYSAMQSVEQDTLRQRKMRWNLFIIFSATFFTGGSIFLFIMSVTDYVGKVLYGGDLDADPASAEYALYEEGVKTGSLGMLIMNIAYVAFSLVHRKVLSFLGPKKEYLLVSAVVSGLLLSLQLTDKMPVYYILSASMGLHRAVLYTVPFMLANQQCHQEVTPHQVELQGHGHGRVGSTMALVTCALPSSFLVACALIGPLIDATGNPGTPMLMSVGFCLMACLIFIFYRP